MPEPAAGSLERWALDLIRASDLRSKLSPGPPPRSFGGARVSVTGLTPGRPPELAVVTRARKQRGFASPHGRARLLHAFFHHELQAAELFAWAILAYPDASDAVRLGFARLAGDELRHAAMYADEVDRLGFTLADFPVRDWFWERVPLARSLASFAAVMGLGFEAANLDHATRFEAIFRDVGDVSAARVQAEVARDEIAHVRFGVDLFRAERGALAFEDVRALLPSPLSPGLMRGEVLDRVRRREAGLDEAFLDALDQTPRVAAASPRAE